MNSLSSFIHILKVWVTGKQNPSAGQVAKSLINISYQIIFWGWNTLFLFVVYLGFLPLFGAPLIESLISGEIPFPFVIPLLSFLSVPLVFSAIGLTRLRKHPASLMRLFYGVEAPIMALSILRMFVLRELTPASTLLIAAGALAIATVALELFFGYAAYSKGLAQWQMAAHTVVLTMGLYVGAFLMFYTVPILWAFLASLLRFEWVGSFINQLGWIWQPYETLGPLEAIGSFIGSVYQSILVILGLSLFGFSATLFVGMPYALVVIFTRSWDRIRHAFTQQFGQWSTWLTTAGVVATLGLLFVLTYPQPQTQAFALLEQTPDSAIARQALIQQSPKIRRGLLNAYLMRYRYLSSWEEADNLQAWYPNVLPISREQAGLFQRWHNALLSPFLYQGDPSNIDQVAELYANFFDTPIQKAEADAIQHALESTVQRDTVEASLLNITDRVVALARQEVTVEPAGDWAEVTLYERYENFTLDAQEIVYQFSMPESAVFTELWLAEPGVPERYRFVVSPRGAAQAVYKQEIERIQAEDPALLEQVGPRQYRLRVFPIPGRTSRSEPGVTHLWMTYQVAQQDGAWPLPQLTEKRNIYWTQKTERVRSGNAVQQPEDIWYEATIAADTKAAPQSHTATLPEGYTVTATPLAKTTSVALTGQKLAVLIDTSRSMGDRQDDLTQALKAVSAIAKDNTLDWFITSDDGMAPHKVGATPDSKALSFYGNLSLTDQLKQLNSLREEAQYDAIFVLTDAGNYELEDNEAEIPALPGSLWLVHLGGNVPTAYADQLQQRLSDSQGGVTTTFEEAAARFASERQADGTIMDGYRWAIAPGASSANQNGEDFQALAARQAIRWLSRSRDVTQVEELDALHAIAKRTEIVTPYSSMLVLVNDRQREALEAAENSSDRFAREIETGEDTLTNPNNPLSAPVPEKTTSLGVVLVAILLLWGRRRHRLRAADDR
ncbi:TIGR02921 family PEP-CTERM protein [Oscillatoria sp. CS-180]|uniref:TIGR02921 family PEP-CTERM protein n=1 Tax=Oscillatoria sp. CS-180 TaxID=3021720 RepID=UPI00232D4A27|nr:TIGR02921 family PEP-CTERM protein [Oscillatoria sp. CS-180]MDB9528983.1 TIGR02921 family PEP-CTERM protein [Oscillatoria sp. CS-180]